MKGPDRSVWQQYHQSLSLYRGGNTPGEKDTDCSDEKVASATVPQSNQSIPENTVKAKYRRLNISLANAT